MRYLACVLVLAAQAAAAQSRLASCEELVEKLRPVLPQLQVDCQQAERNEHQQDRVSERATQPTEPAAVKPNLLGERKPDPLLRLQRRADWGKF